MMHLAPFLVHIAERNGDLMLIKRDYFFFGGTDLFYTALDGFGPGWGDQSLSISWLSICTCSRHISSTCTAVASLLQATKAVWRPGNETSTTVESVLDQYILRYLLLSHQLPVENPTLESTYILIDTVVALYRIHLKMCCCMIIL